MAKCESCNGSGLEQDVARYSAQVCPVCEGHGFIGEPEPKPVKDKKVVKPIDPKLLKKRGNKK